MAKGNPEVQAVSHPHRTKAHDFGAMPRSPRYNSLDHWRGIACALVVIYHTTTAWALSPHLGGIGSKLLSVTRGFHVGVQLFFVISGYCISATADSSRRKRTPTVTFFKRRFRRIFPPYWFAIALFVAVPLLVMAWPHPNMVANALRQFSGPTAFDVSQWIGNLTLSETWRPHFGGSPTSQIISPAWTLCFEEQFYLVVGLILLFFPRRLFFAVAAVTIITLVWVIIYLTNPAMPATIPA
jgi:peptidoglycan/LPS O-acetylase OafA/YrhL